MGTNLDFLDRRADFRKSLIHHHSARAAFERRGGILHIDYSGVLTLDGIRHIDRQMLPMRQGASSSLERMDKAMTVFQPYQFIDGDSWPLGTPPSAVIVRDDQYASAMEFSRILALHGVVRMCWHLARASEAQAWVSRVAQTHQR